MSNSTRNTLVLAVILILVSALVTWQLAALNKKTEAARDHNRLAQASIDSLELQLATIDSLRLEYELQQAMMGQQSKLILGEDSPSITYGYLLDIMQWMKTNVNFDFAVADAKEGQATYNEYILSGKTRYANLLNLANQIEKQRLVMTVEDFSIGSEGTAQADTVSFSMVLRTHFITGGPDATEIGMKAVDPAYTAYPLFMPRISEEMLPWDVDPALLNVEDAKLIGISRGMAFFRDAQGIIRILSKGSRVAYGYLYKVDESVGKVVFKLAKYGLEEDYNMLIDSE
ncbi:MAG: hypothetical protein LHW45_02210 [Candidatus Cloacimonetes bacterium]|nr:hypothetical protein [Candidatus Cloacimonadota bacterium]MDY0366429.1 hypothetical protein [Candidatus Syntrophosphaera sp.]